MSDYYNRDKEKLGFKEICLGHYKKIFEIVTNELRGGYYNYTFSGNNVTKQYITDKRAEFNQAVEILALALVPWMDPKGKKDYEKYLNAVSKVNKKYFDDDGFFKAGSNETDKIKYSTEHLKVMKELFKDLSCLMHRLDYFKVPSYSEGDIEEARVVDVDAPENTMNPIEEEEAIQE